MIVSCDLHVHSCLSPCAEAEMTPGNIVAMAKLKGLQLIALTDHQSCANCGAAIAMAEAIGGPLVLPGLEVESAEEIHLLCYLPSLAQAERFGQEIRQALPERANRPEVFGEQILCDEHDRIVGREARLLLQPCRLDSLAVADLARRHGGVCLPAHIDRDAYSMVTTLGTIPPEFPGRWVELTRQADQAALWRRLPELARFRVLRGSDAHRLADLAEPGWPLAVPGFRPDDTGRIQVIEALLT
jgi:hypothetical protein